MFLYEGDCLKNVTVIRGVRYVTVSHYSGDKEVCDKLGDMLTDAFRSCNLHEVIVSPNPHSAPSGTQRQ